MNLPSAFALTGIKGDKVSFKLKFIGSIIYLFFIRKILLKKRLLHVKNHEEVEKDIKETKKIMLKKEENM